MPVPVRLTEFVLHQPLDDLAVNFFMFNYVGNDPTSSQFGYLPDFYSHNSFYSSELQQSLKAVGIAGYAKMTQRADLMYPAMKSYSSAIRHINSALSSASDYTGLEATLVSVMLLAMYEVLTVPGRRGLENLTKHLKGAISIASLCLKQRKQTDITQKLFGTVVQTVIMNSWIQNMPLPREFFALKSQLGRGMTTPPIHAGFLDIVAELVQLRSSLSNRSVTSPSATISKALVLDDRLKQFAEAMPQRGRFEDFSVSEEAGQLVYNGHYHGMLLPLGLQDERKLTNGSVSEKIYGSPME